MSEPKKLESEFLLTEKQARAMLLQGVAEHLAWKKYGDELLHEAEGVLGGLSFQDMKDIISSRFHGMTYGQEQTDLLDMIDAVKDKCVNCSKPMFLHQEHKGISYCP